MDSEMKRCNSWLRNADERSQEKTPRKAAPKEETAEHPD